MIYNTLALIALTYKASIIKEYYENNKKICENHNINTLYYGLGNLSILGLMHLIPKYFSDKVIIKYMNEKYIIHLSKLLIGMYGIYAGYKLFKKYGNDIDIKQNIINIYYSNLHYLPNLLYLITTGLLSYSLFNLLKKLNE